MKTQKVQSKLARYCQASTMMVAAVLCFYAGSAMAADTGLAGVAGNLRTNLAPLITIITLISYIAGLGFAFAAMLKFKAHKDNPTQVPLGQPIMLLFVAAGLIFLPSVFKIAGESIFGTTGQAAWTEENAIK